MHGNAIYATPIKMTNLRKDIGGGGPRNRSKIEADLSQASNFPEAAPHGGVTVSTGSFAAKRHAGGWAPVIARKMIIADHQLAYAA
jgi:hypothetical protein